MITAGGRALAAQATSARSHVDEDGAPLARVPDALPLLPGISMPLMGGKDSADMGIMDPQPAPGIMLPGADGYEPIIMKGIMFMADGMPDMYGMPIMAGFM